MALVTKDKGPKQGDPQEEEPDTGPSQHVRTQGQKFLVRRSALSGHFEVRASYLPRHRSAPGATRIAESGAAYSAPRKALATRAVRLYPAIWGWNGSHARATFGDMWPLGARGGQEPTSVNSMMVGSVATREWGVPGVMCSHDPGASSSSSPSTVKRSRPDRT